MYNSSTITFFRHRLKIHSEEMNPDYNRYESGGIASTNLNHAYEDIRIMQSFFRKTVAHEPHAIPRRLRN